MPIYRVEASEVIQYSMYVYTEDHNKDDASNIIFNLGNSGIDFLNFAENSEGLQIDNIKNIEEAEFLPDHIKILVEGRDSAPLKIMEISALDIRRVREYCENLINSSIFPNSRWTTLSEKYDLYVWKDQYYFYADAYCVNRTTFKLDDKYSVRLFKKPAFFPKEIKSYKESGHEIQLGLGFTCCWDDGCGSGPFMPIQNEDRELESWIEWNEDGELYFNTIDGDYIPQFTAQYFKEVAELFFNAK